MADRESRNSTPRWQEVLNRPPPPGQAASLLRKSVWSVRLSRQALEIPIKRRILESTESLSLNGTAARLMAKYRTKK